MGPLDLLNPSKLLVFDLACSVLTKLKHYFICKFDMSFKPVTVIVNFVSQLVCQCFNVFRPIFWDPHVFLFKFLFFILLTLVVLRLFIMLWDPSVQHIIFVHFFHLWIVLQVRLGTFLIGDIKTLNAFLYYHQIYFLLLELNLIIHLQLWIFVFTKTFISLWNLISTELARCVFIN